MTICYKRRYYIAAVMMRRTRPAPVIAQGEEPPAKKFKVQGGVIGKGGSVDKEPSFKGKKKLPSRLIDLTDSADKKWHEKWCIKKATTAHEKSLLLNFPHPFRAVLVGPPNSGKHT